MVAGILYTGLITYLVMTLLETVKRRTLFGWARRNPMPKRLTALLVLSWLPLAQVVLFQTTAADLAEVVHRYIWDGMQYAIG